MSDGSPQQFALDVRKFAQLAGDRAHLVVKKVVLDLGTKLVERSPVGDPSTWKHGAPAGYTGGHFRANWQYAEGAAPGGILPTIDKSGRASISRITTGVMPDAWGKVHYLVNNLPYGPRLESGWSKQAPNGMVGLAVREFQSLMSRAVAEAKR